MASSFEHLDFQKGYTYGQALAKVPCSKWKPERTILFFLVCDHLSWGPKGGLQQCQQAMKPKMPSMLQDYAVRPPAKPYHHRDTVALEPRKSEWLNSGYPYGFSIDLWIIDKCSYVSVDPDESMAATGMTISSDV